MKGPESVDSQQESRDKSQEQLANQKFDEIFNKLQGKKETNSYEFGENGLPIKKNGNIKGEVFSNNVPEKGIQNIFILWDEGGDNESLYKLSRRNGKFQLSTHVGKDIKIIDNLTPEELLNNILPNFEKRINEGEINKKQERQKAIEDANLYAHQQDQQDAERLLEENSFA